MFPFSCACAYAYAAIGENEIPSGITQAQRYLPHLVMLGQ